MDLPIMIGNNNERHKTTPNIAVTLKRLIFITTDFGNIAFNLFQNFQGIRTIYGKNENFVTLQELLMRVQYKERCFSL